jgi:AcrR family transcriptional regulator
MSTRSPDRRVRRTRLALQNALVELISEHGYESITVQEIIDRADVGRSTFYAHFRDKDELLLSGFERLQPALVAHRDAALGGEGLLDDMPLELMRHMQAQRPLFKALLGRQSGSMLLAHVEDYMTEYATELMTTHLAGAPTAVPVEVVARYVATSFLSMAVWWLDSGSPFSADEMASMLTTLISPGVHAGIPQLGPMRG